MLLQVIAAAKWVKKNWKLAAAGIALAISFTSGWHAHRYVKTAELNAAEIAENKAVKVKEEKGNEKLSEVEKRNAKVREKSRAVTSQLAKNRGINGDRRECIASPDGVRGINEIRRASDSSFNQ